MARPVKHTPIEFVRANLAHAKKTEEKTGISHVAILAQAALESAWGKAAPGNMFFGVKDNDGINGNEQLIRTTEYHSRNDVKYPKIDSITPVVVRGQKKFKYICWDYFRKFATPEESFTHHANLMRNNRRYAEACAVGKDPRKFAEAVARSGYATAPNYYTALLACIATVERAIKRLAL